MTNNEIILDEFEYKICVEYNNCSECPFGVATGEYFTCGICTRKQKYFIYTDNSTKDNTLEKIHNIKKRDNDDR